MYTAAFAHTIYTIFKQISYNPNVDALMSNGKKKNYVGKCQSTNQNIVESFTLNTFTKQCKKFTTDVVHTQ